MAGYASCDGQGKRRRQDKGVYRNETRVGEMGSVHPFETMFVESPGGSKDEEDLVRRLSNVQVMRKHSSFTVCGGERKA